MRELVIPASFHERKLKDFLQNSFPKGYVEKLFRKKGVRVNGLRGQENTILKKGDVLTFYVVFEKNPTKNSSPVPSRKFTILYENEDFFIVDKPGDISVHEGKNVSHQASLLGQFTEQIKSQEITPFLVHRLDQETSGCLIVAKNEETAKEFEDMFEQGQIQKEYMTLLEGMVKPKEGEIKIKLEGREKMYVEAHTKYQVIRTYEESEVSLAKVWIETGRKHQIRIHFARIHHPVVLDNVYGNFAFNKMFRKLYGLKRQFLHAAKVSFVWKGKKINIMSPLPKDLQTTLGILK